MSVKELAKAIDELSLEDARKLVEELKALGYSAPEPAVVVQEAAKEEIKSTFGIKLIAAGPKKLDVVKLWKNSSTLSLMESKALIDTAPVVLKQDISKEEADSLKKELDELGAEVIIF